MSIKGVKNEIRESVKAAIMFWNSRTDGDNCGNKFHSEDNSWHILGHFAMHITFDRGRKGRIICVLLLKCYKKIYSKCPKMKDRRTGFVVNWSDMLTIPGFWGTIWPFYPYVIASLKKTLRPATPAWLFCPRVPRSTRIFPESHNESICAMLRWSN